MKATKGSLWNLDVGYGPETVVYIGEDNFEVQYGRDIKIIFMEPDCTCDLCACIKAKEFGYSGHESWIEKHVWEKCATPTK